MTDKQEIISSIWEKVEELESLPLNQEKTVSPPNKIFAIGVCCLIFLAVSIYLIGEAAYWTAMCFVPVAYLIDRKSWIEEVRNSEEKFFAIEKRGI